MPITLDVTEAFAETLRRAKARAARCRRRHARALQVSDIWRPNREQEARACVWHDREPSRRALSLRRSHAFYVGGTLEGLHPAHYDYSTCGSRRGAARRFERSAGARVVAFQTRNPMHRAHQELTIRAAQEGGANLLIHPVVGMTKPGDVDHYTRVRCYGR